jgi:hypothetical protein
VQPSLRGSLAFVLSFKESNPMDRLSFFVKFAATYTGQAGSSGTFTDPETKEIVSFSEARAFDFEDAEGNVQRLKLRDSKIVQLPGSNVDPTKLVKYADSVEIEGEVVLSQDGGRSFFRPVKITKVARS